MPKQLDNIDPVQVMRDFAKMGAMTDITYLISSFLAAKEFETDEINNALDVLSKKYKNSPGTNLNQDILNDVMDEFKAKVKMFKEVIDADNKSSQDTSPEID